MTISLDDARRRREEEGRDKVEAPHGWMGGPAYCTACKHGWDARAPVGTWMLECPSCGTHRGIWRTLCTPPDEGEWWKCGTCDGFFFYATPDGLFCIGCNMPQKPWD